MSISLYQYNVIARRLQGQIDTDKLWEIDGSTAFAVVKMLLDGHKEMALAQLSNLGIVLDKYRK